jgi:hypothetical protein
MSPRAVSGDGIAMAWRAGAQFTMMERSGVMGITPGFKHRWYTGAGDASYENVLLVDANGKALPIVTEPGWRQKNIDRMGMGFAAIREKVLRGEYALPFYGDFPSMPEIERKVVWNMLLEEESTGKIIADTYSEAGFDPAKDQLQNTPDRGSSLQWQNGGPRGRLGLKTTLDGLYAAGTQYFLQASSFAAATGRYAGKRRLSRGRQTGHRCQDQISMESRSAPVKKRWNGLEGLRAGIAA